MESGRFRSIEVSRDSGSAAGAGLACRATASAIVCICVGAWLVVSRKVLGFSSTAGVGADLNTQLRRRRASDDWQAARQAIPRSGSREIPTFKA
jgi:hypothetical protein